MNAAELRGVSYVYSKNTPFCKVAVNNIDIAFEEKIVTGIIGHTGSGKSTVSQMLNGLLKPSEGVVLVEDKDIWSEPKKIRNVRFAVGLVFQYPEYQLFEETVYKDIAYGPKNMGLSESEIDERVRMAASLVGITEDMFDKSPFDLSGGWKRRVAIAGVMAMRPKILILDEPAAGLDPRGRDEILSRIVEYRRSTDSTVIMISHSMEDMAVYCEKILVMSDSKPFMYGTPAEVFSKSAELESVGLAVPQVTKLMTELKARGYHVRTDIYTVAQAKAEIARLVKEGAVC
ncbi:MAG: energy-coupling factor transporter ATPase [Clostridia bacterium]|nr:energy-coupling factor transporter ATPase [Clostridia bacterium]MBQ8419813.1 energy-coupling factor transporter ATPase [Clostridia bacterium]